MRAVLPVLVSVFLCATTAAAQQSSPPPPPVPAALAVPNPLAALTPGPLDLYRSPDGSDRFQTLAPHPAPPIIVPGGGFLPGPYFPYGPYPPFNPYAPYAPYGPYPAEAMHSTQRPVPRGGLVLESLPDAAQVYVDGDYVGTVQDFGIRGRALELPAGGHRVELRSPGYELLTFNVTIKPNEVVRFRGDMQTIAAPAPQRATPSVARKTLYIIPNCYAGDRPPVRALPKGCDRRLMQTRN
jgi:hypothetical protein